MGVRLKFRRAERDAVRSMYAMRRANGDWFAVDDRGHLRVPVFHNSREAMVARGRNGGMMLFTPTTLDAGALTQLLQEDGGRPVSFWMVDDPAAKLSRGRPLDHAQLTILVGEVA